MSLPKLIVVLGTTACGKSGLGVELAKRFDGEIVSADSRQVYKGLDLGTGKVTEEEMEGVPHHMLDVVEPNQPYSVADFQAGAYAAIDDILARGRTPFLVGGTGLYVQSFLNGVRFAEEKAPEGLRDQLTAELAARGPDALYAELQAVDPEAAAAIHPHNHVRVLRALEHYRATGRRLSEQKAASLPPEQPYRALVLGLDFPQRDVLYRRIDARVDRMMEQGLLEEARLVWARRQSCPTAAQAIGYKEFFPFFAGEDALEHCVSQLKQASRRYAKRQLTWFRHMDGVVWLEAGSPGLAGQALRLAQTFLHEG